MIKKLKEIYQREQFNPKILGVFINPFYFVRKGLYKHIAELAKNVNGKVLDVGCGQKPYQGLFKCDEYIGLEIDTPENRKIKKADLFYDGKHIPVNDSSIDWVVTTEVFEHVFNPDEFLFEIQRVLKPGGGLLMTVPFIWDEHEQPYDFARYSSFGLRHLLIKYGFEIVEHRKINNGIEVIFQLINCYLYKVLPIKNIYIKIFITSILTAPINLVGLFLSFILPKNNDLYLNNIILARKIKNV